MLQFTTNSFLWLLACLAIGAGYAFLLYQSSSYLQKSYRNVLFALRSLAVAVLAFLLFAPLIRITNKMVEKPLIIVAQDNSASIGITRPAGFNKAAYEADFKKLVKELESNYEVRTFNFGGDMQPGLAFQYGAKLTNISAVFKNISDQFSNRNIGAVVLATDGIYNKGGNPQYESVNVKSPVYTVALGDTIPRRDILVANVNYNNIVYLDNQFQVEVSVEAYQCKGVSSTLTVSDQTGTLFSKPITINSDEFRITVPVTLLAKKKGIQRFNVRVTPVAKELSAQNNVQTIFMEVLDGKEKVLLVANAPHPDIAAIRQSVEINKNYEVKTVLVNDLKAEDVAEAGLLILHQLPSVSGSPEILRAAASKPAWYIIGAQTNVPALNGLQNALGIASSGSVQEVTARVKTDFYSFTLTESTKNRLQNFAPLLAPFGNYGLKGPASVLLTQQIGKVVTDNPLLLFADEPQRKIGILAGEGLWRWRLEDFEENENHEAVDELINKTVQYLSTKEDKRKFRVYPARRSFDENERVILNGELYNDSYELVNTPDVNIVLKNGEGNSYNYVFSKTSNAYELDAGVLPAGEYDFSASTKLGKVNHAATGQFIITQQQAEFQRTTANHQLLYEMAAQSTGKMVYPNQLDQLPAMIRANEQVKTISYENKRYEDLIDLKVLFFLIAGLLTIEWFARKRSGEV
ncbi:hypothetical protein [Hufsiella ginkgonis]|uniref:VWA domain-containing protein n=1 Tax=Hufsiella ginkgonis TaxID=2695274 RepID=A0A7K1Y231_9SPHI|nr:hypothetical protein [Hufsiella ginkgonis]MXV17291.1 hypothetical protein [Hufsiella ginkgonis]